MSNTLKDQAMKTATRLLGSAPAAGLLSHPKLQDIVRRVINLRTDVRDALDERVATLARHFDLVTQKELKHFKRMVRELENQVASLEHELAQQRRRAERAEGDLDQARKDAAAAAKKGTEPSEPKAAGRSAAAKPVESAQLPLAADPPAEATPAEATPEEAPDDAVQTEAAAKKPTQAGATAKKAAKAAKKA